MKKIAKNLNDDQNTRTIIVALLLVFVYPVGLILMYSWMKWPRWVKIIISLPLVLAILGILVSLMLVTVISKQQFQKANVQWEEATKSYCTQICNNNLGIDGEAWSKLSGSECINACVLDKSQKKN